MGNGGSEPQPEPEPEPEPEPDPDPVEEPPPEEPQTGFEECATQTDEAQLKPLDMVIMLDRSGSMNEDGKWASVTSAIDEFVTDPGSDGLGVGLGYFPEPYGNTCLPCDYGCGLCYNGCCSLPTGDFCWDDGDCDVGFCYNFMCHAGGGNATCEASDYAAPDVQVATLPAVASTLQSSMSMVTPQGGTPTGPALAGALDYAKTFADDHVKKDVVVVLATDGEPTECEPQGIADIAAMATDAAAGMPAIATFVIGVGANLGNLNAIAAAGGTGTAYLVDADDTAPQKFLDALNDIRKVAVACEYEIPDVKGGSIVYDLVNVTFTVEGQPMQTLGYVGDISSCDQGGWYYDNPANPDSIHMCPSTCMALQATDAVSVEIIYGCETVVN